MDRQTKDIILAERKEFVRSFGTGLRYLYRRTFINVLTTGEPFQAHRPQNPPSKKENKFEMVPKSEELYFHALDVLLSTMTIGK